MEEIGDFKVIYPQIPKNDHFYPLGVEIPPQGGKSGHF